MEVRMMDSELARLEDQNEQRKAEIARQAMDIDFAIKPTDIEVNLSEATRFPFEEIAKLGSAFASIPEPLRAIAKSASPGAEQLYRVVLPKGATGALKSAGGGNSYGFALMKEGGSKLAELVPVSGAQQATIPVDPTTLAMAIALTEITSRLDAIQETQQEMFSYIKNKDKAELRGNLETLSDVLENYRFNWDNKQYKHTKHILVQTIRSDAEKAIIQHRAEINGQLGKKGLFHIDKDVREKTAAVRSELEEYRLAVYLYSFGSFLEVMLLENFDQNYLKGIVKKIEDYSIGYRKLYTQAYNLIEADADSSVRAMALGGLSGAMGFLGKAIEKTPVGDATPIDEALIGAGKGLKKFSKDVKQDMMSKLTDARSSDVRPFIDNIESVNRMYNEPVMLLADEDAIYLLPINDDDETISPELR